QLGIALVGLVRGKHVVVRGDDAKVRRVPAAQRGLVLRAAGGEAVREVAAGKPRAMRTLAMRGVDAREIGGAAGAAALGDAGGDFGEDGVERHGTYPGIMGRSEQRAMDGPPAAQALSRLSLRRVAPGTGESTMGRSPLLTSGTALWLWSAMPAGNFKDTSTPPTAPCPVAPRRAPDSSSLRPIPAAHPPAGRASSRRSPTDTARG